MEGIHGIQSQHTKSWKWFKSVLCEILVIIEILNGIHFLQTLMQGLFQANATYKPTKYHIVFTKCSSYWPRINTIYVLIYASKSTLKLFRTYFVSIQT